MLSAGERARNYRLLHPERIKEQRRTYREKHRDELRERRRAYVAKYPERIRAYDNSLPVQARRMIGWRRRQYGISETLFQAMLEFQCNSCAICDEEMNSPHVDHDHKTGKVRGLLCGKCNKAIGLFGDDTSLLATAQNYVAAHASGVFTLA